MTADAARWVAHFAPQVFGPGGCPSCGFLHDTLTRSVYDPSYPCPYCGVGGPVMASDAVGLRVPPFCTTDDLIRLMTYLVGPWRALEKDFATCDKLTDDQRAAFKQDANSFEVWGRQRPFCDADEQIAAGNDFVNKMHKWYKVLRDAGCQPSFPEPENPTPPKGGLLGDAGGAAAGGLAEAAKWIAIAVGLGAAAYMIGPKLRGGK